MRALGPAPPVLTLTQSKACAVPGRFEIEGAVMSRTVTLKPPEEVLPEPSWAEHCTVVLPRGKVLPDAGEQFIGTFPLTTSVAEAV